MKLVGTPFTVQATDGPFFLCTWNEAITGTMGEAISFTVPVPRSGAAAAGAWSGDRTASGNGGEDGRGSDDTTKPDAGHVEQSQRSQVSERKLNLRALAPHAGQSAPGALSRRVMSFAPKKPAGPTEPGEVNRQPDGDGLRDLGFPARQNAKPDQCLAKRDEHQRQHDGAHRLLRSLHRLGRRGGVRFRLRGLVDISQRRFEDRNRALPDHRPDVIAINPAFDAADVSDDPETVNSYPDKRRGHGSGTRLGRLLDLRGAFGANGSAQRAIAGGGEVITFQTIRNFAATQKVPIGLLRTAHHLVAFVECPVARQCRLAERVAATADRRDAQRLVVIAVVVLSRRAGAVCASKVRWRRQVATPPRHRYGSRCDDLTRGVIAKQVERPPARVAPCSVLGRIVLTACKAFHAAHKSALDLGGLGRVGLSTRGRNQRQKLADRFQPRVLCQSQLDLVDRRERDT